MEYEGLDAKHFDRGQNLFFIPPIGSHKLEFHPNASKNYLTIKMVFMKSIVFICAALVVSPAMAEETVVPVRKLPSCFC